MSAGEGEVNGAASADTDEATSGEETRLVWNPFLDEWTGFSPVRMRRRELTAECPFCADLTTGRVPPDALAWIRPNDFPAFQPPLGESHILIYSPDHDRTFAELTVPEVVRVIGLWRQVYTQLASRYPAIMTWETSGEAIGQTQRHPHGQTYALSVVPDYLARELRAVARAESEGRACPFCAELRTEEHSSRMVFAGEGWVGFVPAYAHYPYQVRITPRRHIPTIDGIAGDGPETEELATDLLWLVRAYNRAFKAPMPYMLAIHQHASPLFHVHLEMLPVGRAPGKLKFAASSEMAWGFWMNDSLPEEKAAELRALITAEGNL